MIVSNSGKKPNFMVKRSLKKNLLQIRHDLFKNYQKSSYLDSEKDLTSLKLRKMLSTPDAPSSHRHVQVIQDEAISPRKGLTFYKSSLKETASQFLSKHQRNASLKQELENENQPTNRKRRATQGSKLSESQPKQCVFHITKRPGIKFKGQQEVTRKVNYNKFVELFKSDDRNNETLDDDEKIMELKQVLGLGANTEVREGRTETNKYAIKIYSKQKYFSKAKKERVYREIKILSRISRHPNVINLLGSFQNKFQIHLVFENIQNGKNLKDYAEEKGNILSERQIKKIFFKIVKGVAHLHGLGISHRDLKPANVMIGFDEDNKTIVKIIDFGGATEGKEPSYLCGTPNFISPQVIAKSKECNPQQSDIWALGIILFYLSQGRYPFTGNSELKLYQNIKEGQYEIQRTQSPHLKAIIKSMLEVNPQKRITIKELARADWFFTQ